MDVAAHIHRLSISLNLQYELLYEDTLLELLLTLILAPIFFILHLLLCDAK